MTSDPAPGPTASAQDPAALAATWLAEYRTGRVGEPDVLQQLPTGRNRQGGALLLAMLAGCGDEGQAWVSASAGRGSKKQLKRAVEAALAARLSR